MPDCRLLVQSGHAIGVRAHFRFGSPFVVWPRPEDLVPNDIRFFFNSDKSKSDSLYEMHVGEFQRVIDTIVTDEVVWVDINRDTGRFRQHNAAWRAARRGSR
jgi:hypothetical protein